MAKHEVEKGGKGGNESKAGSLKIHGGFKATEGMKKSPRKK